jgi:hypothetical protein
MIPHSEYAQGSLSDPANSGSVYTKDRRDEKRSEYLFLGQVSKIINSESILIEVRSQFKRGDQIEIMSFEGNPISFQCTQIQSIRGDDRSCKTSTMVRIPNSNRQVSDKF